MKKYLTIFFFTLFISNTYASIENNIIERDLDILKIYQGNSFVINEQEN